MNNQNKSMLPLIEILISTGIFAIAVVLTLQLFMLARFLGYKTSDTAKAVFKVQYIAETIKSMNTQSEIEQYTGGAEYLLYYDKDWRETSAGEEAVFVTSVNMNKQETQSGSGVMYKYTIELYKIEPYPFADDKKVEADSDYRPLLASVNGGRYITG